MQAFRDRRMHVAGIAGLGVTAALLLSERGDIIPFARGSTDIGREISVLQETLPAEQADGSVLEEVTFDGRVVTLHFVGDDRLGSSVWRESGETERCSRWKRALRSRQVASVEYRYRVAGSVSSIFVDRAICS